MSLPTYIKREERAASGGHKRSNKKLDISVYIMYNILHGHIINTRRLEYSDKIFA